MYLSFDYYEALSTLSTKLRSNHQYDEAVRLLERLTVAYPGSSDAYNSYGGALFEVKKYSTAVSAFEKARLLDPYCARSYLNLAKLHMATENTEEAIKALVEGAKAIDAYPNHYEGITKERRELAGLLDLLGQPVPALALIEGCIELEPTSAENYFLKGALHLKMRDYIAADEAFQKAMSLRPNDLETLKLMIRVFIEQGDHKKALHWIDKVSANTPLDKFPDLALMIADIFEAMGDSDTAIQFLKNSLNEIYDERVSKRVLNVAARPEDCQAFVRPAKDKRLVVFVADQVRARAMNIAQSIRAHGWRVVMLCNELPSFKWEPYFDEIVRYESPEHALLLAMNYNPQAYHIFSGNADVVSVNFIRERPGKIIFDPYDTVEGFITQSYTYKIGQMQHFCMENADGICARDLRCRYMKRKLGYTLPQKKIFFSDYCSDRKKLSIPLSRGALDEIHVACCGTIATGKSTLELDWGYAEIARKFAQHGIHFHIYPHPQQANSPRFQDDFSDFIKLSRETDYFHLHRALPMDKVTEELSQYHFGINASFALTDIPYVPSYHEAHFKYCTSARNTEYLDAGLPLILNGDRHQFQFWTFDRMGVAVDASKAFFENPRKILLNFARNPKLIENIQTAQKSYSHEQHIPRLIKFYEGMDS